MLLSQTVLSELYQEKLVTEDEVERMKGERRDLSYRIVHVQYLKPPEVVDRTAHVLAKHGLKEEAKQLIGWWRSKLRQFSSTNYRVLCFVSSLTCSLLLKALVTLHQ